MTKEPCKTHGENVPSTLVFGNSKKSVCISIRKRQQTRKIPMSSFDREIQNDPLIVKWNEYKLLQRRLSILEKTQF